MPVRVGINGFGRIGRNFFRAAHQAGADFEFVAVNDLTDAATLAHLLKYDSVLGRYHGRRRGSRRRHVVDGKSSRSSPHRDPAELPWADLGADVVLESTGFFADRRAEAHLDRRREQGRDLRARQGSRRHARAGRQRGDLRPRHSTT